MRHEMYVIKCVITFVWETSLPLSALLFSATDWRLNSGQNMIAKTANQQWALHMNKAL